MERDNQPHAAPRKRILFFILCIFIFTGLAAYSTVINSFFISDDLSQIGKVLNGDLSPIWGRSHGGFFRPLFILSYFVDAQLWNSNPFGFHLTNIALHALNSFLVFVLSFQLIQRHNFPSASQWNVSLAAGFIFLLHPSHTEAVAWISGRADVIATLFCLASLICCLSYLRLLRAWQILLALLSFALALLAKESAACLPFVILVICLVQAVKRQDQRFIRKTAQAVSLFLLVLLIFILIRYLILGSFVGGYGAEQHLNFAPSWIRDRLLQFPVRSFLPPLPIQLSSILLKPLKSPAFLLFAFICVGIITTVLMRRRRRCSVLQRREQNVFLVMLCTAFLCSLLPVINLRLNLYGTQGERFIYLPTVFSSIALAYISHILIRSGRLWLLMIICVPTFYSVALFKSNQNWMQAGTLSQSILNDLVSLSTRESALLINLPDHLGDAPVYRNVPPEALRSFRDPKQIKRVGIIALHGIQSAEDRIELVRSADSFSIQLLNEQAVFDRISNDFACVEILDQSKHSLKFRFNNCPNEMNVFFFDNGKIHKVQ